MTEQTFVRELERRAEHVQGPPLTFDAVRGRARQIQRRRRTAAAAGVAALVALVAVVPTLLTGGDDPRKPQPAPVLPSAPGASVLHDGVVTRPDGSTVPVDVDNADVTELAVLTDGRIVLALSDPYAVQVHSPDGALLETYDVAANDLTTSADDEHVAWVGADLRARILSAGADGPETVAGIPMPGEAVGSIDAVLGPRHYLGGDYSTTTYDVTGQQQEDLTTGEPLRVTDVSPDGTLWAVQYADDADPQYGCAGLYDPATEEMVARSCETADLRFSPDGQHLLGLKGDNNMFGTGGIYDLDLAPTGAYTADGEGEVISEAAWADADHVLVTMANWQTSRWWLQRVGTDWADPEVVEDPAPGRNPESIVEFILSE